MGLQPFGVQRVAAEAERPGGPVVGQDRPHERNVPTIGSQQCGRSHRSQDGLDVVVAVVGDVWAVDPADQAVGGIVWILLDQLLEECRVQLFQVDRLLVSAVGKLDLFTTEISRIIGDE